MPRTYEECNSLLTGRTPNKRKLENNTYLERRELNAIAIRLHQTDIMTFFPDGTVTVNSGGWKTVTTKARLNEFLPHGLGISQRGGIWYWFKRGGESPDSRIFQDGDTINKRGTIKGNGSSVDESALKLLRKRVNKYAAECANQVPLPRPGAGDCFYCQMIVSEGPDKGKQLGDASHNHDHIESHMDESYCVPSLVYHAMKEKGCSDLVITMAFQDPAQPRVEPKPGSFGSISKDYVKRSVARYVFRRLGMVAK